MKQIRKGSHKNNFPCLGAETLVWQGARTAHTLRYGKDEQRRQTGWIDAQTEEDIIARALRGRICFFPENGPTIQYKRRSKCGFPVKTSGMPEDEFIPAPPLSDSWGQTSARAGLE